MFETYYTPRLTPHAVGAPNIGKLAWASRRPRLCPCATWTPTLLPPQSTPITVPNRTALVPSSTDRNYYQCWLGLKSHFDPEWTPEKAATLTVSREAALQAGGAPAAAEGAVPAAGGAQEQQNGQGSAAELAAQA